MAITEPLTLPTAGLQKVTWKAESAVGAAESEFTFEEQVQAFQGQRLAFDVRYKPALTGDAAETLRGFLLATNGRQRVFVFGDPSRATPRGAATGTPLVNGANQKGETLVTDGWTTGVTGIMKAGDYLQLGSGITARLHQVVQDADSDGSGNATLEIFPGLVVSPSDNDAIVVASPVGIFRMDQNLRQADIDEALFFGVSFGIHQVI